jgi:hypothetical protein
MIYTFATLWALSGWFSLWLSTPKAWLEEDTSGYVVIAFCGAVLGPICALMLLGGVRR